jgi:integrase
MSRGRRRIPGITVYQLKSAWSYRITGEPETVSGRRIRPYKGGFATEEEAWRAAVDAKKRLESGRTPHAKNMQVGEYFQEWLKTVKSNLKETTAQSYSDMIKAYVNPSMGSRRLGDLKVPTLNAFYRDLRDFGRRNGDSNWRMYSYWLEHRSDRDGYGPKPRDMAAACETTLDAAREAARRYRCGRVPNEHNPGLSPKSIKNIHVMMHKALGDAVAWGYLLSNPAAQAVVPRSRRRQRRPQAIWNIEELGRWLTVALDDSFAGMWLLAATSGMRRSELAGVRREMLDLAGGQLHIEDTRVVVNGQARVSDGKSTAGRRDISLDSFTCQALAKLLERLDGEQRAFGPDYPSHGLVMVNEAGRPLHPDSITARFNRLVDRAGVRHIRLHDVRHTYATLALDMGVDPKTLSDRIGHANMSVTLQIYGHRSHGRDQAMAQDLGELIQSATGLGEAKAARLVTDLVTGGTPGAKMGLRGPPENPSGEHEGSADQCAPKP